MPCPGSGRGPRLPDQPGRHVPEGLDLGRGAHGDRTGCTTPLGSRPDGRRGPASRRRWDEALDLVARPSRADPAAARARRRRGASAGAVSPTRRPTRWASSPGSCSRTPLHRLQRPVLHVLGRRRCQPHARHRPRPRLPARRPRGRGCRAASSARTSPRRCRHSSSTSPAPDPAAGLLVVDPRGIGDGPAHRRRGRASTSPRCRAPTSWCSSRCSTCSSTRAWSTRSTSPSAPPAGMPCAPRSARWWPERAEAVCGVPADTLRATARRLAAAAPVHGGPGRLRPHRPGHRAVHPGHRRGHGRHQPRGRARPARPRGLRLRPAHRPGQRPGRSRARPEGDQLPGYRMIADPAARAHVAGGVGRRPRRPPRPGRPGRRAAAAARHAGRSAGPARARGQPRGLGAERSAVRDGTRPARPARRRGLRALGDGPDRRRRAARDPVGRGGGHHDHTRGSRRAPPQGARPAR